MTGSDGKRERPQHINLYTEELRPTREKLQASTAVTVLIIAVIALAAVAGFVRHQNSQLADQLTARQQQVDQLEQSVAELTREVESRQPDPQVEAALARVDETLVRRQRLLSQVENLMSEDTTGFSAPLSALARQVPGGVWLTRIRLNAQNGNVGLNGRAQSGQLVPSYLQALGEEPAFQGKTFGAFRLERSEEGRWIEFRVATDDGAGGES